MNKREFLASSGALVLPAIAPWLTPSLVRAQGSAEIVVVGGGFAGATAARYLKYFAPQVKVTLIEPNERFVSCPMSNRVLHGAMGVKDLARDYEAFSARFGIRWIRDTVSDINPSKREVILRAEKKRLGYTRLIVAPGVDFDYGGLPGLAVTEAQNKILHAWKAGPQTQQLRDRLHALPDGATIAMHIPKVPYRCPPGPYERASLIAFYLKSQKPKSKLLVFDANPEIQSKKDLFLGAWKNNYSGILTYTPDAQVESVDANTNTVKFALHGTVKADLWNIIPPQTAGQIAKSQGLANVNNRWCGVDFRTYESLAVPGVHVIGDSIAGSPGMAKSGHMANQEAKVAAAGIAQLLAGQAPISDIAIANTCYSFVTQREAIHVASVFRYDEATKAMVAVKGAGGLSESSAAIEGVYAMAWFTNILNDAFG